jgi:hypothetical protein
MKPERNAKNRRRESMSCRPAVLPVPRGGAPQLTHD